MQDEQQLPNLQGKTVVLIDSRYFSHMLLQQKFYRLVDFRKLSDMLCNGSEMFRSYFYDARTPNSERFLDAISRIEGFVCRLSNGQSSDLDQPAGSRLRIIWDINEISAQPDVSNIILISGAGDIAPSITIAKARGKKVYVVGSQLRGDVAVIGRRLKQAADGLILLGHEQLSTVALLVAKSRAPRLQAPLPQPSIVLRARYWRKIEAGEIAEVRSGAEAICKKGGTVIAYPNSKVHAHKGATVYLFHNVKLSGTTGFKIIPCVRDDVGQVRFYSPAQKPTKS